MRKLKLRALVTHSKQQLLSGAIAFKPDLPASEILFSQSPSWLVGETEASTVLTLRPVELLLSCPQGYAQSQLSEYSPHDREGENVIFLVFCISEQFMCSVY